MRTMFFTEDPVNHKMNVMELLMALHAEVRRLHTCSDEEWGRVLREIAAGPLPWGVEAARNDPLVALTITMDNVSSTLQVRPARMRIAPTYTPFESDLPDTTPDTAETTTFYLRSATPPEEPDPADPTE